MRRIISLALLLVLTAAAQAQTIIVDSKGELPTISDFVTAIVSQDNVDESLANVGQNWKLRQQGRTLQDGVSFIVDQRNGYVRYDIRYSAHEQGYTEFCYWRCNDGRRRLVAVNSGYERNGIPMNTQFSGLSFYIYDNASCKLSPADIGSIGALVEWGKDYQNVTYALPREGKNIEVTVHKSDSQQHGELVWQGDSFFYAHPDGIGSDGRGPDEVDTAAGEFGQLVTYRNDQYVRVINARQLLNALGSERNILVAKDTEINLTPVLDDKSLFDTKNRVWSMEGAVDNVGSNKEVVASEEVFDGRQLTLVNMKHLTIEGEGNSSIVVEPRYAFCLRFVDCEGCTLSNITIGHTDEGYCQGGVIGMTRGRMNTVLYCDLYGCGAYGLVADGTDSSSLYGTIIRDCSYGIMQLTNCQSVKFYACDFFRNKEFTLVEGRGCNDTVFSECRFFANNGDSPLFYFDSPFMLIECKVWHPTENLGTTNQMEDLNKKSFFSSNPLDPDIKSRSIGPGGSLLNRDN